MERKESAFKSWQCLGLKEKEKEMSIYIISCFLKSDNIVQVCRNF